MNTSLASNHLARLQDRAHMFKAVRCFFEDREILEVDTPLLCAAAPLDPFIDILETDVFPHQKGYFHSSPEYGMKKLLAQGFRNIYQLSHVYRKEELGAKHAIEFTMAEWYRSPFSFNKLLEETKELICLFLGSLDYEIVRYEDVLQRVHGLNPLTLDLKKLTLFCKNLGFISETEDKDIFLSFLWDIAERTLGHNMLSFVTHFPASQAALSQIFHENGLDYAARFEAYYQGLELANGYHELTNPTEQKKRFLANAATRAAIGKPFLPMDENLLKALEKLQHLDIYGVAVGFDRLMMLRHRLSHIQETLPLTWGD